MKQRELATCHNVLFLPSFLRFVKSRARQCAPCVVGFYQNQSYDVLTGGLISGYCLVWCRIFPTQCLHLQCMTMLVIIQTFEFLRLCLEKTPPPPKPLDVSFPPGAVTQKWLPDALRIRVLDPAKVRVGRPITKMHGFPTEVVECWRKGR